MQSGEVNVNQMMPEIVRIGVANARIKCVTPQRVEYLDEAGRECFVDLEGCVRNWVLQFDNEDEGEDGANNWDLHCVGRRGMLVDPPWIEFANKRRTRFEFGSNDEARALLGQLAKVHWRTFDCN
jgi:hypothetical protein